MSNTILEEFLKIPNKLAAIALLKKIL